ncbi:MAG: twin-arginine translocase subunit TatC [Actinomycetales bacterium]|nr:twin-arginine translocase subunit TatC [Actinomycetales bacterium]
MLLQEHFREFRSRVLLVVVGLLLGAVGGWFLFDPVFNSLAAPVREMQEAGREAALNFTTVASAFDMRMRVSLFLGALITSPWWLYQMWAFLAPGLKRNEKKYVVGFTAATIPLFLLGAAMGWFLLPHAVAIFMSVTPDAAVNFIDARTYLTFSMRLILAFGVAFLFPVVMIALNLMGLVRGRTFQRGWRWAIVLMFTFAAFANPLPDPWTMIALGLMMTALYYLAVWLCILHDKRVDRRRATRDAELGIA